MKNHCVIYEINYINNYYNNALKFRGTFENRILNMKFF